MTGFVTLFLSISLFVAQFTHTAIPILHTTFPTSFNNETDTGNELSTTAISSNDNSLGLTCGSAILMEASTGTVIYEKNATEPFRPASITKIMTLILIFDALAEKRIAMEDTVTVSEYASSMGGSQVY
ncbi:MAG: hypothetical protein IKU69_04010, partial [Roseburia sp.]|nr:hypothetical protein [Roseburia sp.]